MQRMKEEMTFVMHNIEIIHPDDVRRYSKDAQKMLRYMISQKRSYIAQQMFALYKGKYLLLLSFVHCNKDLTDLLQRLVPMCEQTKVILQLLLL